VAARINELSGLTTTWTDANYFMSVDLRNARILKENHFHQQGPPMKQRAPRSEGKAGSSKKVDKLAPFREDSAEQFLTTNQGLRIHDDQNSLKAGERGPSLIGRFPPLRKDHAF
jgi:hypothetical protein